MTARGLRRSAFVVAGLVAAVGAAFPLVAASPRGAWTSWDVAGEAALAAFAPALGLVVVARLARGHRLAAWAALVGAVLTLALGVALYAAALRPEARPSAPALAAAVVPLRQLAAVAVAAWAVWIARRTREGAGDRRTG